MFETHTKSGVVAVAIFLQGRRRVVEMDGGLIRGLVSNRNILRVLPEYLGKN